MDRQRAGDESAGKDKGESEASSVVVPEGEPDFWHVWSARVSELLGRTLDETPAAIGVLDTELRYRYVNATLARLNGVPADEHVGRTVAEVVPGVEAREDVLRAVIADGVPRETVSSGHAHADSPLERRYLHGAYHRLSNEGRTMGIVGILLDVSAARQEQRELERAQEAPRAARRGRHPGRYHPGHGHHLPATCVIAIADPAEGICIYASARRLPPRRPGRPPPRPPGRPCAQETAGTSSPRPPASRASPSSSIPTA